MPVPHKLSAVCCERAPDPRQQRTEIVRLIKNGADIHESDKNGVTPLHHAVRFRSPTAVETLLAHGAEVNRVCRRSGSTALHRAVTSTGAPGTANRKPQALEIIELLLKAGADPSIKNRAGKRPIDYVRDADIRAALSVSGPAKRKKK